MRRVGALFLLLLPFMVNIANAKSKVYGSLHAFAGQVESVSGININSYSSRLGVKGINFLNDNWEISYKLELELNTFNDAFEGGDARKLPSSLKIKGDEDNELDIRNAWLGFKGDMGEFRVGRHISIYDIVDNGQDLLTKVGHALPTSKESTEQLLYVNKSGFVGYSLAYTPFEDDSEDRVVSGLLNYAEGPFYAGLGLEKSSGLSMGSKLSLGYGRDISSDAAYSLGLVYDKQLGSAAKSISATALYSFGKMYVGAELGKVLSGDVLKQNKIIQFTEDTKSRALELGYHWNKDTKVYMDYSHLGDRKETSIAIKYDF